MQRLLRSSKKKQWNLSSLSCSQGCRRKSRPVRCSSCMEPLDRGLARQAVVRAVVTSWTWMRCCSQ
eukprot:5752080-Amphidinium_carterae.1